ncbi:MAG: MBL fold metallo-hydrolase [Candidatus Staskawiczbacteria bacterium]|nr:MBL fold metallo-hydrolase [Candidatus Staskawiczbacteria bacterium]
MAKIYWAGQSCFQIEVSNSRDHSADIVIDPLKEEKADILLLANPDNKIKTTKSESFVANGPGEYEVRGVFIQGIPSAKNTIYVVEAEDMRFCHLGELGQPQLTDEQLEKIGAIDVLMISVAEESQKVIGQVEPKIVIPMNYDDVAKFLKTMGKPSIAPVDKLTIKSSALPKEGAMEIVVLKP